MISDRKGGDGCVRDIIEQVLRVQGNGTKILMLAMTKSGSSPCPFISDYL